MRVVVHSTFGKQSLPKKEIEEKRKEMPVFCFNIDVQCAFTIPYVPMAMWQWGMWGWLNKQSLPNSYGIRIRLASLREGTHGIVPIMMVMSLVDWP